MLEYIIYLWSIEPFVIVSQRFNVSLVDTGFIACPTKLRDL